LPDHTEEHRREGDPRESGNTREKQFLTNMQPGEPEKPEQGQEEKDGEETPEGKEHRDHVRASPLGPSGTGIIDNLIERWSAPR
jgi:hypothetical protein